MKTFTIQNSSLWGKLSGSLLKSLFISFILVLGTANTWAYDISEGSHIYLVNTDNWSGCQLYIWKSDGYNTYYTFSKIQNTNIYHYHFANSWNGYQGVKFRSDDNWTKQSSNDIKKNLSSCYFVGTGTTNHTTLANMNGAAKVVSMVSIGGNYTAQANSACVAKVSGYNLAEKASTTNAVNASTGNADNASINAAYGSTITYTATAGTGYTFDGFSTTNSTSLPTTKYTSGKTATASAYGSSNNTTYYAYFTLNQYTITYNLNGGSGTMTPTTYTIETTTFDLPTPTKAGFTFEGWYTTSDFSGSKVTQITKGSTGDKTFYAKWAANANTHYITYTTQGTGWTYGTTPTSAEEGATVTFVVTPTTGYDVTVATDGPQLTRNGNEYSFEMPGKDVAITVSATEILSTITIVANPVKGGTLTVDGQPFTSGGTVQVGVATTKSVTTTPNPGYRVKAWSVTNSNIVQATGGTTVTLKSDGSGGTGTLYANYEIINYNITYNLDGGTNNAGNPATYTIETPTITLKDPTKTGYTFNGWYSETGFTNQVTQIATGSTGDKNLYAKWTENTVTISPTNAYDHGNPGYANPTASNSGKIGISSTSQLVAPSPGEGYTFAGWTLSDNIVVTTGNASSNRTITVRHKTGDGSAVSAVANYKENLDSRWHLVGSDNIFPDGWNVNDNSMMKKRSGSSSEKKVYMTITVSDIKTYEFKVVDDNGSDSDKWYGYSNDSYLTWTETSEKTVYQSTDYENKNNLKFTPNAVGDYEFKVDYSGTYPKVTITYPEVGSVSSYRLVGDWGNGWDATGIAFDAEGKVSLELEKRERPDYTFKVKASNGKHYTAADEHKRQFTRQHNIETISDDTDYPVDNPHNLQLQADAKGTYIFEFDPATKQLKVTHPEREDGAYLVGDFSDGEAGITDPDDSGKDWTEEYGETFDSNDDCTHGVVEVCDWGEENVTLNFKIKINGIWYGFYHEEDADPLNITTSGTYTLEDQYAYLSASNVQLTTNGEEGCYYFEYTVNPDGTLSVLIIFPNDRRTVTFDMQEHGTQVEEQHVLYNQTAVKPYVSDVAGYLFGGWYTDANCTAGKEYDFTKPVTQDITLYAKWIPYENCIFYKNNLNWDSVYVYFYSSDLYWDNDKGTGAQYNKKFKRVNKNGEEDNDHSPHYCKFRGKMTQIGLSEIWYFDYISAAKVIDPDNWTKITDHDNNADNDIYDVDYSNIAFTAHKQDEYEYFDNTKVIRRGDFKPQMQLFIPQTDQTPTYLNKHNEVSTKYYNKGLWMKYNDTYSGYDWSGKTADTDWGDTQLTADIAGEYSFVAEVYLNVGKNYEFKIKNLNDDWYGNNGTMTAENCTNWHFETGKNNATITPTVTGYYTFTVYLGDGKVMVSLEYPLVPGDYRLAYKDNTAGSFHPGHYIKKRNKNQNDTVSFFIHHDKEPQVIVQVCTEIDVNGNETWATMNEIIVNPAASITETGVYNFVLQQLVDESTPRLLSQHSPYTGDYYIRTYAANGGWRTFRHEDNLMTYSSYADVNEDFDHYFCKWVDQEKGMKNVSYTVANNYSYCISDTLLEDIDPNHPLIVTDEAGDLPDGKSANVRFGWDSKTNKLRRAYIAGSGHKKDRFLVLEGNEHLTDINGNRYTGQTAPGQDRFNLTDDEVVLDDMGNWIYQMDVQANKDTKIQLTARYNELVQYFKGTETKSVALLASTATTNYKIRLIYDFKTNHLVIAWLAGGEKIDGDEQELGADMMIIRRNQDPAEQLNFDPTTRQLSGVGTAYAVITFDKYFLNNKDKTGNELAEKKSENERKFYWISFPFDVKLSDVFGFGEYGDQWIMEYYDGKARAKEGYWAETETFWKYITNKNYVLKAGQGYVLCLNLNKMGFTSTVFAHTTEVSLYFPSASPLKIITGELPTEVTVPAHECTIERDNRNIYDSNWNLIGVPGFADIEEVTIGGSSHTEFNDDIHADCVSFYYKYLPATNKYDATNNEENFQTMYAYMVQFAGTINWRAKTMPAQLAARRTGSMPSQHDLRLELAQGEETDQTFVQLKEADATAEFDMNVDMTKIFNSGMNIYTLTGSNAIQVAGNALPMAKATIPVGVVTATAGEYTFRMPDGTDGISVFLIDNQTGAQTNMLLDEYTVTLDAGTCENRFYLAVDPNRTATSVENIGEDARGEEAKGVEKFLIDGQLFIRTTDGIFDAKGQRL